MLLYRYITGPDDASFCQRITALLNNGWRLQGNATLTFDGERVICGQTVIKEVKDQHYSADVDLNDF